MSNRPKPRSDVTGKFLPTRNPRSERVYLTKDEYTLIQRIREGKIDLNRVFAVFLPKSIQSRERALKWINRKH